ncbi:reprolysin-like metallopeptidase [Capnocytophaga gingivalis]|uniref:reprolysin-like metallopeptidase n=1 Tax=Capnocytophaga gingivalis TaxID=1017 RepID=UPI0028D2CE21|nr:M12 family metallo-peptidase [Capnocytophaga gingivalis]
MKKIYYLFSLVFAWFSTSMLYAQEKTADVLAHFSSEAPVHWAVPTNEGRLDLEWRPRQNSLSQEGFRSFVAYHEGVFSGSISLSSNSFSGEIWHEGHTYFLTDEKGLLRVSPSQGATSCATCQEGDCDIHPSSQVLRRGTILAETSLPSEDKRVLYNVHVQRTFRLAMLIDYSFYKGHCRGHMELAKAFMVDVQTKLNEVCGRELGYQFELVNDPRLIRDTKEKEVYPDKPLVRTVVNTATDAFNKLIGEENYDAGIVFSVYKDNRGLAHLGEITGKLKGGCVANEEFYIILHELGHLLGSAHTFTIGGATASSFTEPDRGNSIMSYINDPYGTYFSLPSIYTIHNRTNLHDAYYTDKARTQLVGLAQPNIPYGEPSDNKAPMIDRSKLRKSYTLPPNTYFQFTIEASDPDGDPLLYMAHQADFKVFGKARFPSNRPTTGNKIAFYRPYTKDKSTNEWKEVPYKFTGEYETGDFTFWLGVCDGSVGAYKAGKPHTPLYDVYQTKVQIKDGTPFRITNIVRSSRSGAYKRGEDVTLHWSVDKKLFAPDSKVRILFSDNYGKTYDYVLAEGVPNNGEATVTFPQAKGWKGYAGYVEGLFKIEVLDHIAYAVDLDKLYMKDMVKSDIIFNNLPKPVITVKRTEIPERAEVTARSVYCNDKNTMVSFSEETHPDYILRRWVATDKCKNKATFVQYIYFEKEAPTKTLHFVGDLPQDIHVQCRGEIPPKATLQAEGSDSVEIEYEEEMTEGDKKAYKLTRVWTAYAADAPAIRHVQQIFLKDTQRPEFSSYPPNLTVKNESEIPSKPTLTATDNCDARVDVSSSSEPIYDKQGKKIGERNVWFAEDAAHNENRYEQIITIDPQKSNTPQPLSFVAHTLPQSITVDCSGKVPSVQLPLTSGGCSTPQVTYQDRIKVQHAPNDYVMERTYKAKDNCGEVTHLQLITVKDDKAPVWIGQLPQPKEILQGDPIPEGAPLTAQDNCEGILTVTPTKEETSDHITYQWVVSDSNGNKATHTQVITIKPKKDIPAPTPEPKPAPMPELNNKGIAVYNGISTESGSQNYFKIENTDDNTPIEVVIFNEMGLKVYESSHYQQGSDVFRGYANVRGVVGSGQRLPTGTYFYVIHYYQQGVSYMKKGYLYVR